MSNTAVLFQALPSPPSSSSSRSHHHNSTRRHMIPHAPPPPTSHDRSGTTNTTTRHHYHHHSHPKNHTTTLTVSSPHRDDHIRRGAQMVRQEISTRPHYDDDDDVEITTEDHQDDDDVSVTSWSQYDVTVPMTTTTTTTNRRIPKNTTIEIDPPSSSSFMADWSVDDDDDDDRNDPEPTTTTSDDASVPPRKAAHPDRNNITTTLRQVVEPGFIRSDDDDDNHSDIVEIHEACLDPFASSPLTAATTAPLSHFNNATVSSHQHSDTPPSQQQQQRSSGHGTSTSSSSHSSSNIHQNNNHNNNNSDSDGSPYRHRTVGLSSSPTAIRKAYPLPLLIHPNVSSPPLKQPPHSTHVDRYQNHDDDDPARSPEHAVREVPIHTPSTVSNLSSPGGRVSPPPPPKQSSSSSAMMMMMIQYDSLLRDPAYRHAQNAGFIWQSIVGQHIRFPCAWWNGARGPPIHSGYDHNSDTSNIPWMYFGRHTIRDHPVLNQLVKCRASAGRLLLHIVVLDLMTRTPIQDIVIGCFHPNSKGIRSPNSPPLKRYENCRDIWMAVRKRNHTAVAATDSLMYSPSHWENPRGTTTPAYQYSISRSPLGSGQRVTNANVRAVFGDTAPLETIFLSEDELYERLARTILLQQQAPVPSHRAPSSGGTRNDQTEDRSPALAILQELVFA